MAHELNLLLPALVFEEDIGAIPGRRINTDLFDAAAASEAICCVAAWRTSWSGQGLVPYGEVALRRQLKDQLRMQYL
jgi:hypothetical protein